MRRRDAQIIPIANFVGGTNQAPGFMRRAQGAAEEMENLVLDLEGRPVIRKGYTVRQRSDLGGVGTDDNHYTDGEQIAVVHWLGDEDTPEGIKRAYFLPRHASWVQDENGRLMFIAAPGEMSYFIDIKENVRYEWNLDRIDFPVNMKFTTVHHGDWGTSNLGDERNENAMRSEGIDWIYSSGIAGVSDPSRFYAVVQAATDIKSLEVVIVQRQSTLGVDWLNPDDDEVTLYSGAIEQGSYIWYWDSRDFTGEPVDADEDYRLIVKIHETDDRLRRVEIEQSEDDAEFSITWDTSSIEAEYFSVQKQLRFVCVTYANPDLNIETRPSPIRAISVYDVLENSRNREVEFGVEIGMGQNLWANAPSWATRIYVYASLERVPLDHEITEAQQTGMTGFRRIAEFEENELMGRAKAVRDGELLDSFDHDGPPDGLHVIGAYGVGLWGATQNHVYFNKIDGNGDQRLYALPSKNALVPHSFPLSHSGQSPILHIHPAAHEAALLAFKRDVTHIIKGKGIISGLYDPLLAVQVDVDASHVVEGIGTISGRTVVTVGSAVYFVGSDRIFYQYAPDWRGNARFRDVGLPIQKYLNEIPESDMPNLVAFLYRNCYHLITPNRVVIMDMSRNYWTAASWELSGASWSRGGVESESIIYATLIDGTIVELYTGDTDDGEAIGAVWHSNPLKIPSESVLSGVMMPHVTVPPPTMRCRIDVDDVVGEAREFTPAKYNDFRFATFSAGSRIKVRLESDDGFPVMDRINAEVFIGP